MSDPYTVLHGGFHKTASTFLQRILHRNQGYMRKQGVYYVHHRDMRKEFTVPCQLNAYMHAGVHRKTVIDDDMLRGMTQEFFAPIAAERPHRLILSDENLAGHCGHCVKFGQIYRFRDPFIRASAKEIPYPVREVHLAVRNYADFFAAAYVEYIRSLQEDSPDITFPHTMTDKVFKRLPGWVGAIESVKTFFPSAKIYLWTFEDFRDNPAMANQIIRNLVGPDVDTAKFKEPKDEQRRPSASAKAMQEIQNTVLAHGIAEGSRQRRVIQDMYPRNSVNKGFDPWSPWERAHLTNLYAKDLSRLAKDPAVVLVQPDPLLARDSAAS